MWKLANFSVLFPDDIIGKKVQHFRLLILNKETLFFK